MTVPAAPRARASRLAAGLIALLCLGGCAGPVVGGAPVTGSTASSTAGPTGSTASGTADPTSTGTTDPTSTGPTPGPGTPGSTAGPGTSGSTTGPHPCGSSPAPPGVADSPVENLQLSVTAGANAWIRNPATEPLALAAYRDGRVITTDGSGSWGEPLPTASAGTVDPCRLTQLVGAVADAMALPLGQPGVTDQGWSVITVRAAGGPARSVSVYAFGIGDEYVPDPAARANRARLHAAVDAVRAARSGVVAWSPDRLRLVAARAATVPTHRWPGPTLLADVLSQLSSRGCVAVTGPVADRVRRALGPDNVLSGWVDGGPENAPTGTLAIGLLLPGQPDCP